MLTAEALAPLLIAYTRADSREHSFVSSCAVQALQLVRDRIGGRDVPEAIEQAAALEVGANLYSRRMSAIGTPSYGDPELLGNPARPALDPLTPAYALLRPYLGPGIA